jgi:hypothetical protein
LPLPALVRHPRALPQRDALRRPAPPQLGKAPGNQGAHQAACLARLNKEIRSGLERQEIKAKYADLGGSTFATSPTEFGDFLAQDVAKWTKLIKFAGLKPG